MMKIIIHNIEWDLTEDDLAEGTPPPTSFEIELTEKWIIEMLDIWFRHEGDDTLTDLIEDKYPFCFYNSINFEIGVS